MAWQDYLDTVQKLYVAYYQRPADPQGLRYWAQVIEDYGIDSAVKGFVNSPEAQSLYQGDIEAVIKAVYNSAFGRDPEPEGLNYWKGVYEKGWADTGTIVWAIVNGAKGVDAIVLENKVESANNFTKAIDPDLDGIGPFNATYSGDADAAAAREFLKDVDATTVKSEGDAISYIQQHIADSGDSILEQSTPASGQTYVLTTSIDMLTGTAGNDLFIGDNTTVSAGDSLNGVGGTDTLKLVGTTTIPLISNIEVVDVVGTIGNINISAKSDVQKLVIENVQMAGTNTMTLGADQTLELKDITNTAPAKIKVNTPATDKVLDVYVDNVNQVSAATDLAVAVTTAITALNLYAQGQASDLVVAGLGAGDHLNIKGDADIVVDLTTLGTPNQVFVDASENTGNVTLRVKNYAPADNRVQGVDKIIVDVSTAAKSVVLSNQTEGFDISVYNGTASNAATIVGGQGADTITGGKAGDNIKGGSGADTIDGGKGADIIYGGKGADTLTGGQGTDKFIFDTFDAADTVQDFTSGPDKVYLDIAKTLGTVKITKAIGGAGNTIKLLTTGGTFKTKIGPAATPVTLKINGSVNSVNTLTAKALFTAKNLAALSSAVTGAMPNGSSGLAIGFTTSGKGLYVMLLTDINGAASGGQHVAKVITVANFNAAVAAADIAIF